MADFRLSRICTFVSLSQLASFLKLSVVLGSFTGTFSAINMVTPLTGEWCGMFGSSLIFCAIFFIKLCINNFSIPLSYTAFFVPGLFGAYYFASQSVVTRFLVPLFCMAFFILHPVGLQAAPYALYWLIPMILYALGRNDLYSNALGSTFVTHAVGSVIWIYTNDTESALWFSLLPIVAVERVLFAGGMVMLHHVLLFISKRVRIFLPQFA